jgi:hypothetical protein
MYSVRPEPSVSTFPSDVLPTSTVAVPPGPLAVAPVDPLAAELLGVGPALDGADDPPP